VALQRNGPRNGVGSILYLNNHRVPPLHGDSVKRPSARIAVLALVASCPAAADEVAAFCPERPGQTTPACVMAPGDLMLESGLASWSRQADGAAQDNRWVFGDLLLRRGVGANTEVQVGWRMLTQALGLDQPNGSRLFTTRAGDVTVGVLHNFSALDGPVALQVFAILPTGHRPSGAGDWGAGVRLPISLPLGRDWTLGVTPEIDAAVHASGHGRHVAFSGAVGVGRNLTTELSASIDVTVLRDQDPAGHTTTSVSSVALAWQPGTDTQLDLGVAAGLNRQSIGRQVYIGLAHRF